MDRKLRITIYLVITAFMALAVLSLLPSASASVIQVVTDNENAGEADWLETPINIDAAWIWDAMDHNGTTNQDFWKFNASAGQLIQIQFRKYDRYSGYEDPFDGATYYIKYEVWDTAYRHIHDYHRTWRQGGGAAYRRDVFSYTVPENLGGRFFIKVWVDHPDGDDRTHAYYFLNVTVEDPRDMNVGSSYDGVMTMSDDHIADFNWIDTYTVNLRAGDLMSLILRREHADHPFYMEVWETIPWGAASQRPHMLNRTQAGAAAAVQVKFIAPHDGTYSIVVWRTTAADRYSTTSSTYSVDWSFGTAPLEGDELHTQGPVITKETFIPRVPIEMGYDVHDWYQVKILAGDKVLRVTVTLKDPNLDDGHAYELVIYNQTGYVMWADSSRDSGPSFNNELELPTAGTTTIFDQDETFYVRVSVNTEHCNWGFSGFRTFYDINFKLSNRAPTLAVPFEEVYTWDEDETISIELDSHFTDPDEDKMSYVIYNKTPDFVYDIPGLAYDGHLNITPPADWNGEVWWRLRAVDKGQTDERHYIYIDLHLVVNPVSDLPRSGGPMALSCDEEAMATGDLNDVFSDPDDGPHAVLTFGWTDEGGSDVAITLDPATGAIEMVPAADVTGTFEFEIWCFDILEEKVFETLTLTVRPVNDVPRIAAPIPQVDMGEGDDSIELDLSPFFYDVDGDDLTYTWSIPSDVSDGINVYHKNNVVTESNIVIELLDDNFYATVVLNITCKDGDNTLVRQDLTIVIINVPNAPIISFTPAGVQSDIDEMQIATFAVTDLIDADELEFGLHNFTWYLDEVIVKQEVGSLSSYVYRSDYESSGPHTVRLVVVDPTGLGPSTQPSWTFNVRNVNRQPTADITTIPTSMTEDDTIILSVDAQDPDGDGLEITWYLILADQDKILGVGNDLQVKLPAGTQRIEVEVTDGKGAKATDIFSQEVKAVEEESAISGMLLGIIILVVIVAVVAFMLIKMRSKPSGVPPEAKMDLESLQKGYDPSQGRGGDAGSDYEAYDPRPTGDSEYEGLR